MIADVLAGRRQWHIEACEVMAGLAALPAESVHCVVTSVPYYGLRDYGTGRWEGGDPECEHKRVGHRETRPRSGLEGGLKTVNHAQEPQFKGVCGYCGAVWVDQQIGLEDSLESYLAKMVAVFAEVRRVLRRDGTLWLNVGDSYNNRSVARKSSHQGGLGFESDDLSKSWADLTKEGRTRLSRTDGGIKEKDLLGVPWAMAFALRADGWYLRSAITWAKKACMPESVQDRPTSATEMVFLLAKAKTYYYDADAVREEAIHEGRVVKAYGAGAKNGAGATDANDRRTAAGFLKHDTLVNGRNLRNYWLLGPEPFTAQGLYGDGDGSGRITSPDCPVHGDRPTPASTAGRGERLTASGSDRTPRTDGRPGGLPAGEPSPIGMPSDAGSTPGSSESPAPACGPPATPRSSGNRRTDPAPSTSPRGTGDGGSARRTDGSAPLPGFDATSDRTHASSNGAGSAPGGGGSDPSGRTRSGSSGKCTCRIIDHFAVFPTEIPRRAILAGSPVGGVVLDPFVGSGTTVMVALRHGRRALGFDLNPAYVKLARDRIVLDAPMFNGVQEAGG